MEKNHFRHNVYNWYYFDNVLKSKYLIQSKIIYNIMNTYDSICKYLISQEDSFSLDNLRSISFSEIKNKKENDKLELTAYWNDNSIEYTKTKRYIVKKSDDIYDLLNNRLQKLRNNITVNEGFIEYVHVNENMDENEIDFVENYPFYTKNNYKYSSMSYIKLEQKPTKNISDKITNYIQKELQKFEKDIDKNQIVEIECLYDDFAECELTSLRGHVVTSKPHLYFENVSSLEEYINKSGKEKQNKYRIFYRIDDYEKENKKPKEFSEMLEPLMKEKMKKMVNITGEYMFEAETIAINNYTTYPEYKPEYIGYTESTNTEYISFYVRQPFNEI